MTVTWAAPAELNVYAVAESGTAIVALLADLDAGDELRIDLAQVNELDAAGLQLLLATALAVRRDGHRIIFAAIPEVVREWFDRFDLAGYLMAGEMAGEGA